MALPHAELNIHRLYKIFASCIFVMLIKLKRWPLGNMFPLMQCPVYKNLVMSTNNESMKSNFKNEISGYSENMFRNV